MRKNILLAIGLIVALPLSSASAGKETPKSIAAVKPATSLITAPAPEAMVIMIRNSLVALSHANLTNNYAVLNALGSDSFRTTNSPAKLAEVFTAFRANKIDLAPVAFVNPILSGQPSITDGRLRMTGFFPTQPMQVNFDLQYEPTNAGWKLHGIAINLNQVQKTALAAPPANKPAAR